MDTNHTHERKKKEKKKKRNNCMSVEVGIMVRFDTYFTVAYVVCLLTTIYICAKTDHYCAYTIGTKIVHMNAKKNEKRCMMFV